jgi:DNA invertase Pin-like site-specific DNA recombinase
MAATANFDIIKIINEQDIINAVSGDVFTEYFVLWGDLSTSWIKADDISHNAIETYKMLKEHNHQVEININNSDALASANSNQKQAFVYSRISRKGDSDQYFVSLESQRQQCFQYCLDNNIKIEFYGSDDGVSGKDFKNFKYELGYWSKHLENDKHILVTYTPDRIGRNLGKCVSYMDGLSTRNIDIHFVKEQITYNKNTQSHHKNIIHSLLVQSENFSNMASERVKNTVREMRKKGHHIGNAPIGMMIYKNNNGIRKMKHDPSERNIIKNIIKKHKQNLTQSITKKESYNLIEQYLTLNNVTLRNKAIKLATVKRLIKTEFDTNISSLMNNMALTF